MNLIFKQSDFGYFCLIEKDLISNNINTTGVWEPHLYYFYSQFIKQDFIIVDGGANIGFHSVQFAKLANEGKTYCFEPQPLIFNVLSTNILFNGLTDIVEHYKLGLGDKKENLKMTPLEKQIFNPNCINWGGRGLTNSEEGEEKVQTVTLDSLNLSKLDFIKLDVQGFEYKAFKGGENTIKNYNPIIFLENYPKSEKDQKVIELLEDWGYITYRLLCTQYQEDCILLNPKNHQEEIKIIENQTQYKWKK
jgi:FkbM family methyltransferase